MTAAHINFGPLSEFVSNNITYACHTPWCEERDIPKLVAIEEVANKLMAVPTVYCAACGAVVPVVSLRGDS